MKLFFQYLKTHIKSVVLFALFAAIVTIILTVFKVKTVVILYTCAVCMFVGLILTLWDYSRYLGKHELLMSLEQEIKVTMDNLPLPKDLIESDYQRIIKASFDDKMKLYYQATRKYDDMIDYYTLWAHQIKTPIAAMRLILQTEETTAGKEIESELFKIEQYVEMVLCYLRLEGNSSDYLIKDYDLDGIVKQSVKKYASQFFRSKNSLKYSENHIFVHTDEKWLLFVLEQLISNALKYTRNGCVEVIIQEPGTLIVKDTGMGIAAEDLPRIFERGFTGYNGRTDKKSTGIGLYLCKRICDNLGHEIEASSQVGKGTEIKITFDSYRVFGE